MELAMRNQHPLVCLPFAILLLAGAAPSQAAEKIETLVVTAHRLPTDDPILPVTRLEPGLEAAVGVDALRQIPNLAIAQSGSLGGVAQVRLRGSEANHALVLIDGIEVNDPANGSEYNFAHLMPFASTAIEFLPGAQSAVWGSDALAGVIHLSTAPNQANRAVGMESGAFGGRTARIQLADRLESGYYNLAALATESDGINISRRRSRGAGTERDGYEQVGWQASGGWLGDRWQVRSVLRGANTKSEYDPGTFPTYLPADADNVAEHDEVLAGVDVGWDAHRWRHQFKLNHLRTENGDFAESQSTLATEGKRTKVSYTAGYRLASNLQAQGFVEHEAESFKQRAAATLFGDPNHSQRVDALSAGLELIGQIGKGLAWSASLRQDDNSDFGNATTHRLALRYRTERGDLWLNVGEGIKNPSFIERFGFTPDTFFGNPNLEPETNKHLSIGARGVLGPTTWALTLFRDRLQNEINGFHFDPALGGFTAVNRDGKSKRQGAEVTAEVQLGNTRLAAGWGYLDAEEDGGGREIRRPSHSGHLSATHQRGRWLLHGAAYFVGSRDDLSFASWPATRVRLGDYQLLRLSAAFQLTDRLEVSGRLENGLDDDYEDVLGYQTPGRAAYFGVRLNF
ncbi:MAG: TonB-dependent receptor [Gammaproteobacteria bacterium]|nr:TonB-dependent receptor [Gammaproteobacteria bacterium]